MGRLETVSRIPVRYAETDRMGIVHHSAFPVYFEVGRTDFFEEHLCHYHAMETAGLLAAVIAFEVELRASATYGDVLLVRTVPGWLKGVRLQMEYQVHNQASEQLVATGSSTHALLGPGLAPVHPRTFGPLYRQLQDVFSWTR